MSRSPAPALGAFVILFAGLVLLAPPAEAAIFRGLQELIGGVLQLPVQTLVGTFHGPPVIGTLFGAVNGAVQGIGLLAHGTLEIASSGVGIAKMVAPYLLPFLL